MKPKLILDRFHGSIELSHLEMEFMRNPLVNRLHYVLQNSTAYLTYPSCKTARFEHSLGVMNYSSQLFINGLNNSVDYGDGSLVDEFLLDKYNRIIKDSPNAAGIVDDFSGTQLLECLKDLIGPGYVKRNISLSNYDTTNSIKTAMLLILYQSLRIFALFHDIGHLPFSHVFEFALDSFQKLLDQDKELNEATENTADLKAKLSELTNSGEDIHEFIGKKFSLYIISQFKDKHGRRKFESEEKRAMHLVALDAIELVFKEIIKGKDGALYSIYSLVASDLDADRMDFVKRDGGMSGLLPDPVNLDRIIKLYSLCKIEYPSSNPSAKSRMLEDYVFLPSVQSIHAIEELFKARFNIYRYLVNHHAVKRSDTMLNRAIVNVLKQEFLAHFGKKENGTPQSSTEYELVTKGEFQIDSLLGTINIIDKAMKSEPNRDYLKVTHRLPEVTDYWLLSYFSTNYLSLSSTHKDGGAEGNPSPLLQETRFYLSEIYNNKRRIRSLWKRRHEYTQFVESLGKQCEFKLKEGDGDSLYNFFETIQELIAKNEKGISQDALDLMLLSIDLLATDENALNKGLRLIDILLLSQQSTDLLDNIEKRLDVPGVKILIALTKNKIGITGNFRLINIMEPSKQLNIDDVSSVRTALIEEAERAIKFFAYYYSNSSDEIDDESELKKNISSKLTEYILDEIFEYYQRYYERTEARLVELLKKTATL